MPQVFRQPVERDLIAGDHVVAILPRGCLGGPLFACRLQVNGRPVLTVASSRPPSVINFLAVSEPEPRELRKL